MAGEIEELARRVAGRVLAERGASSEPGARPSTSGVHVHAAGAGGEDRPLARPEPPSAPRGREWVTAELVASLPAASSLPLGAGARVTPLAREEARRRGIELAEVAVPAGAALRVAVGADHGGYARKELVIGWLRALGHRAFDLGTRDEQPVDYPDFAAEVGRAVAEGRADLGVCLDGAGIGSAIAANKVPGVRAATCWDEASARNAREHNFANVLSLGARNLSVDATERIVRAFLATPEGGERHERRVAKIAELERRASGRAVPVRRVRPPAVREGTE